jgi:hypothetical protein
MSRVPALEIPHAVARSSALRATGLPSPSAAVAALFTCEASPLRGSLGPAPPSVDIG